ncbi:hypothetical protein PHYSODRAFT_466670 [Phytophthora sojae]|uniref:Uncharacterized protein n=1 Tax=Phytophthora sojae (strain P6497) TaxID=1094619 RepID=G4YNL8_PHYSP|nr:hypothetical protein PHYSODRAFT_466670 [Phytophthora sojae]EGZ30417.1 hypothetical protein PHYSODRAFT_466670 [Phytophthora sojae]|eukprot:XP_009517692.1 hypothetical protein PHYSODRAFT_466670 [Phytophthora sojae]
MAMEFRRVSTCLALLLAVSFTIATVSADLPNWVSPVNASQSGCYRKTYFSRKTCAQGYESDGIATCWAQCPLNYPVECGMECIPQSADCTSQMLKKVSSVGTVALNAATAGIFGELVKASKAITLGVKCSQKLYSASSSLKDYADELQANGTEPKQILTLVNQSDLVINQLPTAVATCLGLPVSEDTLKLNAEVAGIVNQIVMEVVANGASLLHPKNFLAFMSDLGVDDSVKDMDGDSVAQLQDVLSSGVTCGSKLQVITDQVTQFIVAAKQQDPSASVSAIRQALSVSKLLVSDIPDVTNNCVRNLTEDAFTTRDSLRSIMSTITDGLVDKSADEDGKSTSIADYLASVAKMGLDVIGILDPTGIADMLSTFIQPICGPTAFMGEIDDGLLEDALALTTEGDAFKGSHGSWKRVGDGAVNITFKSVDTEDVTVNIHSGGDTVAKVKVRSGETVTWSSTVKELQDKTLYFDRWRPGRFNIPTSAGGSLVLWVPHSSTGGNIQLFVKINGDDEDSSESSSSSSGSYDDAVQVGDNEGGSGSDIDVTPAPTTSDNADQVDQSSVEGSNGSDEVDATPAPTTSAGESATPAPTRSDTDANSPEQSYSAPTPTPALCES